MRSQTLSWLTLSGHSNFKKTLSIFSNRNGRSNENGLTKKNMFITCLTFKTVITLLYCTVVQVQLQFLLINLVLIVQINFQVWSVCSLPLPACLKTIPNWSVTLSKFWGIYKFKFFFFAYEYICKSLRRWLDTGVGFINWELLEIKQRKSQDHTL